MSGHALYQSLLMHLLNLLGTFGWVPAGGLGLRALIAALREWQRKAELSGDRAGLLATQDPEAALRVFMKLAGGAHLDRIDPEAFLEQAADYERAGDLRDGVLKLLNTERETHPFAVVRAAELQRWASSEEYARILAGDYPQRADDSGASFTDSAREAARSYKKRIDESTDPLVGAMRGFSNTVGSAADSVADWLGRFSRSGPEPEQHAEEPEPPADDAAPGPVPRRLMRPCPRRNFAAAIGRLDRHDLRTRGGRAARALGAARRHRAGGPRAVRAVPDRAGRVRLHARPGGLPARHLPPLTAFPVRGRSAAPPFLNAGARPGRLSCRRATIGPDASPPDRKGARPGVSRR